MQGILCIDDEVDKVQETLGSDFIVRHPEYLTIEEIMAARLVLVDYRLEDWPDRVGLPISRSPMDGLALTATIASAARQCRKAAPTAFALYSGDYSALASGTGPMREHVVARAYNVEWVFTKGAADIRQQCTVLQQALSSLPETWPTDANAASAVLHDLLKLQDVEWREAATEAVERAFPPIMEVSTWTDGVAVLRWLLHRVFPYPAFLADNVGLALELRVEPKWLDHALEVRAFCEWLAEAEYKGALGGFDRQRWWTQGVSALRWRLASDGSIAQFHRELAGIVGRDVVPLKFKVPVAVVRADGDVYDLEEASRAVPVHVDDWPAFAAPPYMRISDVVGNPGLESRVHVEHRWRIEK